MKFTFVQLTAMVMAISSLQLASASVAADASDIMEVRSELAARGRCHKSSDCSSTKYCSKGKCYKKHDYGHKCSKDQACKSDHCSKKGKCASPRKSAATTTAAATSSTSSSSASASSTTSSAAPSSTAPTTTGNQAAIDAYAAQQLQYVTPVGNNGDYTQNVDNNGNNLAPLQQAGQVSLYGSVYQNSASGSLDTTGGSPGRTYVRAQAQYNQPAVLQQTLSYNVPAKRAASTYASFTFDYKVTSFQTTYYADCAIVPLINGQATDPSTHINVASSANVNTNGYQAGTATVPAGGSINSIALELICAQNTTATVLFSNVAVSRIGGPPTVFTIQDGDFSYSQAASPWMGNNTQADTSAGAGLINWPFATTNSQGQAVNAADNFNQTLIVNTDSTKFGSINAACTGKNQKYVLYYAYSAQATYTGGVPACTLQPTVNGQTLSGSSASPTFTASGSSGAVSGTVTTTSQVINAYPNGAPYTPALNFALTCTPNSANGATVTAGQFSLSSVKLTCSS